MKSLPKTIDELLNAGYFPIDTSSQPMVYKNLITKKELYIYSTDAGTNIKITETKELNQ